MPHISPPSDPEDTINLGDLSPRTQARVRALLRPPTNPPASTLDFLPPPQRNQSGSQHTQPVMFQTQQDHAPMGRENTPSIPLLAYTFQPPRPSFPWMPASLHPWTTPPTPSTPTSSLPTPFLPIVQLPAMAGLRPSPSEGSGSVVPSTVQKRKTGVKGASSHARKKRKGIEGQVIGIEQSAEDPNNHRDGLTALIRDLRNDLTEFSVDLPSPFVVAAEGEVKGDLGLVIHSLGQFVTDQMAPIRGGLLLLATRVSAMEELHKNSPKPPRGERTEQENEAIKYIKSETHTAVQSLLHWKPSDGFGELPREGDKYQDDDNDNEVEINAPHWDERIDSMKNMIWVANVTNLIEGNIKAEIEGNDKLRETLQGISVTIYVEDTLKAYLRHLKLKWGKATTDPAHMKRQYSQGRRFARQREESSRAFRILDKLNVVVAKSANKLDVTGSVTIKEHHLLPEIFSEEESGPEDDTPEAIQEFSEHGKPLQVGEFYLTHSKPYLSSAATDLKTLAKSIYKSKHVRPTNSKKRIEGPTSDLLPPDSKLERWMVNPEWVPVDGPATFTFLKDSVPGDQIGAIMKDALHTWNKSSQILAVGYGGGEDRES